jgi:hypothetical protein
MKFPSDKPRQKKLGARRAAKSGKRTEGAMGVRELRARLILARGCVLAALTMLRWPPSVRPRRTVSRAARRRQSINP